MNLVGYDRPLVVVIPFAAPTTHRRHGLPGDGDVQKLCQREGGAGADRAAVAGGRPGARADLGRGVIGWPDRSGRHGGARLSRAHAAAVCHHEGRASDGTQATGKEGRVMVKLVVADGIGGGFRYRARRCRASSKDRAGHEPDGSAYGGRSTATREPDQRHPPKQARVTSRPARYRRG